MISSSSSFDVGIDDAALARHRFEPIVRDDRAFLGEALGHLLFLGEERFGNEEGKIRVDVARVLEHAIEGALHLLPDGVAVRLDDHAAAHVGVLRQAGVLDDVEIPLRIIFAAWGDDFGHCDGSFTKEPASPGMRYSDSQGYRWKSEYLIPGLGNIV